MNRIVDLFREIENDLINEQRRIRIESPLKVFYGITINKLYRISFISNIKPFALESTKEIKITQGKEKNEVFWTCFDLLNNEAKDVFFVFCDSLIKTVANCKDEIDALNRLREKYYAWRLLLKKKRKISQVMNAFPIPLMMEIRKNYFVRKALFMKEKEVNLPR